MKSNNYIVSVKTILFILLLGVGNALEIAPELWFKALVKYARATPPPPPLLPHLHISFKRKSFVLKVTRSGRCELRWEPWVEGVVLSPKAAS